MSKACPHNTKPRHVFFLISILCAMALLGSACEVPTSSIERQAAQSVEPAMGEESKEGGVAGTAKQASAVKKEEPKKTHHYSPFVLAVQSPRSLFRKISFKDVGVRIDREELRESIYEVMAETLASELRVEAALSMPASVVYDEAILDPANHLACGSDHLYVDVWQSEAPRRWGYSLWSGCGEDDNFAWKEVSYDPHPEGDVSIDIKPLAQSIVASIREANKRGCYQKTC